MNVKMKTYIINLKFDTWENQLWLVGEDSEIAENNWASAKVSLENVGAACTNSNDFFKKAIEHFNEYGFKRVQK